MLTGCKKGAKWVLTVLSVQGVSRVLTEC